MPASSSKSLKVVASLKSSLKAKNTQQWKMISEACDNDFELQLLVLKTISDHNNAKMLNSAQSLSMQLAEDKQKKKKNGPSAGEEVDWSQAPEGVLRRGLLYYKYWGPELIFSAFAYMEPCFRSYDSAKNMPILRVRGAELMTFALDVNCSGDAPDRVAVETKEDLFPRLKSKYEAGGRRLAAIVRDIADNDVGWASVGFYSKVVASGEVNARVVIRNRLTKMDSEVPAAVVGDKAQLIKAAPIQENYSQSSAYIEVEGEAITLSSYFHQDRRLLKRTASGNNGIVLPSGFLKKLKTGRPSLRSLAEGVRQSGSVAGGGGEEDAPGASAPGGAAGRATAGGVGNRGRAIAQPTPPAEED